LITKHERCGVKVVGPLQWVKLLAPRKARPKRDRETKANICQKSVVARRFRDYYEVGGGF
jgi:hypothetical protein